MLGQGGHPVQAAEAAFDGSRAGPDGCAAAEWAHASRGLIIEDDYDGEFRFDRQPLSALQGIAPDRVAYVGTAAKTLGPALRLAWAVLPECLLQPVTRAKHLTDLHTEMIGLPAAGPREDEVIAHAAGHGLALSGLADHWHASGDHPQALIVGYATPPESAYPAALDALDALARTLRALTSITDGSQP